eukprot:6180903-Pleurochrysis_carterae.AAC.1
MTERRSCRCRAGPRGRSRARAPPAAPHNPHANGPIAPPQTHAQGAAPSETHAIDTRRARDGHATGTRRAPRATCARSGECTSQAVRGVAEECEPKETQSPIADGMLLQTVRSSRVWHAANEILLRPLMRLCMPPDVSAGVVLQARHHP